MVVRLSCPTLCLRDCCQTHHVVEKTLCEINEISEERTSLVGSTPGSTEYKSADWPKGPLRSRVKRTVVSYNSILFSLFLIAAMRFGRKPPCYWSITYWIIRIYYRFSRELAYRYFRISYTTSNLLVLRGWSLTRTLNPTSYISPEPIAGMNSKPIVVASVNLDTLSHIAGTPF